MGQQVLDFDVKAVHFSNTVMIANKIVEKVYRTLYFYG